jgi:NADH:ubiquinone oxidoreductase subunit 3 (subunit A)
VAVAAAVVAVAVAVAVVAVAAVAAVAAVVVAVLSRLMDHRKNKKHSVYKYFPSSSKIARQTNMSSNQYSYPIDSVPTSSTIDSNVN